MIDGVVVSKKDLEKIEKRKKDEIRRQEEEKKHMEELELEH